jgi:zinc protease
MLLGLCPAAFAGDAQENSKPIKPSGDLQDIPLQSKNIPGLVVPYEQGGLHLHDAESAPEKTKSNVYAPESLKVKPGSPTNYEALQRYMKMFRKAGETVYYPDQASDVEIPEGTIHINAGSVVVLIHSPIASGIYNFSEKDHVTVRADKRTILVKPGHSAVLTSAPYNFDNCNPSSVLGYRGIKDEKLGEHGKLFLAEFDAEGALYSLQGLQALAKSKEPRKRHVYASLVKNSPKLNQRGPKFGLFGYYNPVPLSRKTYPRVNLKCETYKLKNGLEVILSPNKSLPFVAVNVCYKAGPANEPPGKTGMAHLCEHMMFEGSRHVNARDHHRLLEAAGAINVNANTAFDRTYFYETVPSSQLPLALWLESDRMGFASDLLNEERLANQRDVVRNELRENENRPYSLAVSEVIRKLFPTGHPNHGYVLGSHRDIESVQVADVRSFFGQYYVPNNASLVIAGDFDPAETKALVEKYFGSLSSKIVPVENVITAPPLTQEQHTSVTDEVTLPAVMMAWRVPSAFAPDSAEIEMLERILVRFRLQSHLQNGRQIAQAVTVSFWPAKYGSIFLVRVIARPGVKLEALEKAVNAEVASLHMHRVSDQECDGARNLIKTKIIQECEHIGGQYGLAGYLNKYNFYCSDPDYLTTDLDRFNHVTPASLLEVAGKYLRENNKVVACVIPGKKVIDDVARTKSGGSDEKDALALTPDPEPWRAIVPDSAPRPEILQPVPDKFTLSNGLSIEVMERHDLPIISGYLTFRDTGDAYIPIKPGLEYFTAWELVCGTARRSSGQITRDLYRNGVTFDANANNNTITISFASLSDNIKDTFDIFSDLVSRPTFEPSDIKSRLSQKLLTLAGEKDSEENISKRVKLAIGYSPIAKYEYPQLGALSLTKTITREDVVNLWNKVAVPENCHLSLSGDISITQARSLAERYFGDWRGKKTFAATPVHANSINRRLYIVDCPSFSQSTIMLIGRGPDFLSAEFFPAEVMDGVFGVMTSSRLNMNLREKHGYCYGAYSRFDYEPGISILAVKAQVRKDSTGKALTELFHIMKGMKESPPTAEEVSKAKQYMTMNQWRRFETSSDMAAEMSCAVAYDYPANYHQTLPARVAAVTQADVEKMVEKYLDPTHMAVVIIGDRKAVEADLRKLKLGKPTVLRYRSGDLKL